MKIKYFPTILLCILFVTQAKELSKEVTNFENTLPIVEGTRPWNITIDSSELKPHFIVSKFVANASNNQVYFKFKVIKNYEVEKYGTITGVWLKIYNKNGVLLGAVDHTDSSFEESSKHFSIPKNLKQGAVFRIGVKAPYPFTTNSDIGSVKIVLTKS